LSVEETHLCGVGVVAQLFSLSHDVGGLKAAVHALETNVATTKADVATTKADVAVIKALLEKP
jgi:outer membrane murein-binding lipoprotein Lpp